MFRGVASEWYTFLRIILIVSWTRTLVKRLSTSSEAMMWSLAGGASRKISRKSVVEERLYLLGVNGANFGNMVCGCRDL